MNIIGLNSRYDVHKQKINSGSCALIVDGKIIYALAEDRVTRVKDDGGFDESLKFILDKSNLLMDDIDYFYISFYGNSVIPQTDMVKDHLKLLNLENSPEKLIVVPSHHFSHACVAYFLSPFDEAIIMVSDNEGNLLYPADESKKSLEECYCERNSYYWARGNCIALIERDFDRPGEVGFGKAYNIVNNYIGLGSYLQVGKTMGLSSYGKLEGNFKTANLWDMGDDGRLISKMTETNDLIKDLEVFLDDNDIKLPERIGEKLYKKQEYKNLAYFIQYQLNKWSFEKMKYLSKKVGIKNICISGGVGLNGIMNYHIEKEMNVPLFVPPYPSDPGQALGNAIYGYLNKTGKDANSVIAKVDFGKFSYLGTECSNEEIGKELINLKKEYNIKYKKIDDAPKYAAKLIADGKVIGWFQGRSEYGARALGNRSVLADPSSIKIRDKLNVLKRRELFRPIAPSVLSEYVSEYFKGKESLLDDYMLSVKYVKKEKRESIKGVVHINGTSRLQEVKKSDNPKYHELISEFNRLKGIPMVMNTSFNMAGEPIVETLEDAVKNFIDMKLDYLICGDILIESEKKGKHDMLLLC